MINNANCLLCKDNMKLIDVSNESKNCAKEYPEDTKENDNKHIRNKLNYFNCFNFIFDICSYF